ncbi:unnamed protein product [Durusdinium trenchii]|uniref:Meiosis-specific nuclear structural protein 1 n=1 Tax=Durusdinium trenchii TaxID=1381693 RepID=A0ABP0RWM4_9DINO
MVSSHPPISQREQAEASQREHQEEQKVLDAESGALQEAQVRLRREQLELEALQSAWEKMQKQQEVSSQEVMVLSLHSEEMQAIYAADASEAKEMRAQHLAMQEQRRELEVELQLQKGSAIETQEVVDELRRRKAEASRAIKARALAEMEQARGLLQDSGVSYEAVSLASPRSE